MVPSEGRFRDDIVASLGARRNAAGLLTPGLLARLVLLDPVDGAGRDTTTPTGDSRPRSDPALES